MSQKPAQPKPNSGTHPSAGRHIRGLDGLRALAMLAVLSYHLLPAGAPGGYLGVDVFFVLSGFLITALLLREHHRDGTVNLKQFWLRRIRRLLPAVTIMAVTTLITAGLISRDYLAGISKQFIGVVTFSYNWVEIWRGSSYFNHTFPPLWTNVWSLAVEQQFYLIWPLIVLATFNLPKRARIAVPLTLAFASSIWMAYLTAGAEDFSRAYLGTDSHAFGLMLGAATAYALGDVFNEPHPPPPSTKTRWIPQAAAGSGLIVIVLAWRYIPDNQSWAYPWGTLLACAATIAVIQGLAKQTERNTGPSHVLVKTMELTPLRWLGERSYGIYLWHWPLWVIISRTFPTWNTWGIAATVVGTSVTIAALSYTWVEQPMRRHGITATIKHWMGNSWQLALNHSWSDQDSIKARIKLLTPAIVAVTVSGLMVGMLLSAPDKTQAEMAVERGQAALQTQTPAPSPENEYATPPTTSANHNPPDSDATGHPTAPPSGENVTVIGDSVTVAAAKNLSELLPQVQIDAEVSRSIVAGRQLIDQGVNAGTLRPYVVVALATNSAITEDDLAAIDKRIGPQRRMVVVTGYGPSYDDWIWQSNEAINAYAKAHPQRVKVANWEAIARTHQENLAADQVHPDDTGAELFAQSVKQALESFNTPAAEK